MATLESVERLRSHANVSYDAARDALDACGGDLLDAIIYLERQGKVPPPQNDGVYTTEQQARRPKSPHPKKERESEGETFSQLCGRFFSWVGKIIQSGNRNLFVISHKGKEWCSMPVTIFVLLAIFAFSILIPLLIVGLFFDFHYRFRGVETENIGVNSVMGNVEKAACDIKRSVQTQIQKDDAAKD